MLNEGRRKFRGRVDVFGKPLGKKGPRKTKPTGLAKGWRTKQRNKKLGLHRGQGEFKDPKPYGKEGRSILDHKVYSKIYSLLTESRTSRRGGRKRELSDFEKTLTPEEMVAHHTRMRGGEEAVRKRQMSRFIHKKTKNIPTAQNLENLKAATIATNKPGGQAFENRKKAAEEEKASIKAAIELQNKKKAEGATGVDDAGPPKREK